MPKKRTSFALSENIISLLKKIADKNNRSAANMLEEIIKQEAVRQNIKIGTS